MKSAETQGRGVLPHPVGNLLAYRINRKGRGEGSHSQRASHWGDLSSYPSPHSQKFVFLTFTLCHLKLGTQTRTVRETEKESSTCLMDKSWVDLISHSPEGLLCWQHSVGTYKPGVKFCSKSMWPHANGRGMRIVWCNNETYCFWSISYRVGPILSPQYVATMG